MGDRLFIDISVVVIVSAALAWLSVLLRQPIILAYITAGMLLGPWGLKMVTSLGFINEASNIGISLLLFLAGISLRPREMVKLFRTSLILTIGTSALFAILSGAALYAYGFTPVESIIAGGFRKALLLTGETPKFSRELGIRLGQNSEFSFIIAIIAAEAGLIGNHASQLVQVTAMATMAISSYLLVSRFPTPHGFGKGLKVD
jgi:Kef-type K+ transport system membrane component KefB